MNNFEIIQLREIPFVLASSLSNEKLSNVRVSFVIMLQHQRDNKAVCLHTALRYMNDINEELLHGGASIVAKLPGWLDVCNHEESIRTSPEVLDLIGYAAAFVSGQFFHYAASTPLHSVFVPHIPATKLAETMIIEAVDPMRG